MVIASVVEQVELRNALTVETDHLCVDNRMAFDPPRFLDNARIAFRPVSPVHRVEAYPALSGRAPVIGSRHASIREPSQDRSGAGRKL